MATTLTQRAREYLMRHYDLEGAEQIEVRERQEVHCYGRHPETNNLAWFTVGRVTDVERAAELDATGHQGDVRRSKGT